MPPRTASSGRTTRRYTLHQPRPPTVQQEAVFLTMKHRQMERERNGHQEKGKKTHFLALFVLLLLIFGVGASYFSGSTFTTTLTVETWQIAVIGFWFLVCVAILSMFSESAYFSAICWMLVYWPLLAMVAALIFYGNANFTSIVEEWLLILFIIAEVVTFFITLWVHYLYPKIISSKWFRTNIGAKQWHVQVVADWTMTYNEGLWRRRHTCKYEGSFNDDGLPHGPGKWIDDSYGGEILTGRWNNGVPVAPFVSRQYGTGDAFKCVPIAYWAATDDSFAANKLVPTNEKPPRYGVASVECSVQGAFLRNLPSATESFGPKQVMDGEEGSCVAECFSFMPTFHTEQEQRTSVEVRTSDPRGVEVVNHVYKPTGLSLSKEPTQIIINVHREEADASSTVDKVDNFMPFSSFATKDKEQVLILEDVDTLEKVAEGDEMKEEEDVEVDVVDLDKNGNEGAKSTSIDVQVRESTTGRDAFASLDVQNWISTPHKGALVYFPGFNSPLKQSLETLGQFMAMTKLMNHIRPIIFGWPNGQVPTYLHASAISHSDRNKENLLQLIRGLASAGIRHVHFLSHSMGVQTMLGGFEDKADGSRSDISQCFRLDHAFVDDNDTDDDKLMICKSVTMVNPDFPIEAFVDHAYVTLRRICNHITIVGDRQDQALYYSQVMNGAFKIFGYAQPKILNKDGKERDETKKCCFRFRPQIVVGRDIESIYLPDPQVDSKDVDEEKASLIADDRLLFKGAPAIILSADGRVQEHLWLNLDVIDTTQLDTNIKDLRHSGFNVNPILLNDLEELIVTGRRASSRSTLLFRDGNIYSYCHAPSFVTM